MLIQTEDTLYDVNLAKSGYRVVQHDPRSGDRLLGPWKSFDRMSPVRAGEPVRFFETIEETGKRLLYRVVTTSPVKEVLAA